MVELFATAFMIYLSTQWGMTLINYQITQISPYIFVYASLQLAVFLYTVAPASGGHMNPLITFTAMLCGLCPISRGVLYLTAQTIGAALAGGCVIGSVGHKRAVSHMGGGVFFDPTVITPGQVFLTETVSSAAVV
jgi:glycerol uptake facilitator-like aquaporin